MERNASVRAVLAAVAVALLVFLLSYSRVLYSFDKLITDPLFQIPDTRDNRIMILGIDEKTIAAYGNVSDWSREIPARLVRALNNDPENRPALIAFDILYISERDEAADLDFAEACIEGGNVLTAANLVYHDVLSSDGEQIFVDNMHIGLVEYPYPELKEATDFGFANTFLDRDQNVRYTRLFAENDGERVWSLSAAIALRLSDLSGEILRLPETDRRGLFEFQYTGAGGTYEEISLCDVLDGTVTPYLDGRIVLVGAYAPGMQDAYNVPAQRGGQMYGVEIHANILEAILEGHTALPVNSFLNAITAASLAFLYCLLIRRIKIVPGALVTVAWIGFSLLVAYLFYRHGYVVRIIELLLAVFLLYLLRLASGYLTELIRKRHILNAFKKYVAPQVVEEVASKGDFSIQLGGEKRNIAVLFVDIRGFTPLSEGLLPEQVVDILNEYLALATAAIFKNGGTLDKFIGDAAMAVFNAPFDLEDYVYKAVCAARDIAAGSEELDKKLFDRFGKHVSFGIGVNSGDAVVGNIGCDFRMDYTAIGDTVNTAARLESNARPGQILISQSVYDAVRDRVSVTDIGTLPLKGKSRDVYIYQLNEVL